MHDTLPVPRRNLILTTGTRKPRQGLNGYVDSHSTLYDGDRKRGLMHVTAARFRMPRCAIRLRSF